MAQPPDPKTLDDLTQEDFQAYEDVRVEGLYNMRSQEAQMLSGLDRDTYFGVARHYSALMELYPDIKSNHDQ